MIPPVPATADEEFAPFWEGTRRRELRVQRCSECGSYRWPPRPVCRRCHCLTLEWVPVEPVGALHTWTVVAHQTVPTLPTPYVVGLIELESPPGVRFLGNVVDYEPATLAIGLALRAHFRAITDDVTLVDWTPITPGSI